MHSIPVSKFDRNLAFVKISKNFKGESHATFVECIVCVCILEATVECEVSTFIFTSECH